MAIRRGNDSPKGSGRLGPARGGGEDLATAAGSYWGMSDSLERIRDQSHWLGEGRWYRERWLSYGDFFGGMILRMAGDHYPSFLDEIGKKTALDWGCGGGAVTRVLCGLFGTVWGLEISPPTLRECVKRMKEAGGQNFRPVLVPAEGPEEVLRLIPAGTVDFFFSVGVFKHFPSRGYTRRVLQLAAALMRVNALGLIQYRYDDGTPKYRPKEGDYARNVITMTSLTPEDFHRLCTEGGLEVVAQERDTDGEGEHHQYALVRKTPSPSS